MRAAAPDPLPPSSQQAQHLRAAFQASRFGRELPRLVVSAWDVDGVCDIAAMTEAINTHVRRHETYHSAFEVDADRITRRTVDDPGRIEFQARRLGAMDADQIREYVLTSTPGTLAWDCFTFGVIQDIDHFTVYASIDHLHSDGASAGLVLLDIHLTYQALVHEVPNPLPPTTGYRRHTARGGERVAAMTLDSPQVKGWIDFARDCDGDWPSFPLALGDTWAGGPGAFITVEVLDAAGTEKFDTACRGAGARFSGGAMAAAALTEQRFTGAEVYHGFTPSDTRSGDDEALSVGWYASLFPVVVPIRGGFPATARDAQRSFDANKHVAAVPFERVLELATADELGIRLPDRLPMMVSFMDFRRIPFAGLLADANFGTFGDNLSHGGVNVWINRYADRTTATISFPDNPQARDSVHRYLTALSQVFAEAARTDGAAQDSSAHYAHAAG